MIDAGILPRGCRFGGAPEGGEDRNTVIVEVDGEWTMNAFRKRGRRVRLEPANPSFPTILPEQRLRIAAVVIAVIRAYPT